MTQPIPSNSIRPLIAGEHVQIVPKFQDPGDEDFERIVIEAPEDSSRVLIRTILPGHTIHPTEIIEAAKLVRVIDFGNLADLDPATVIKKHADELTREQRLFFIEKFPAVTLETLQNRATSEEVELCAQLHPSIALNLVPDQITAESIDRLADTHSFAVLLYASHRLTEGSLRKLVGHHPGECIVILERHPESRLRHSLRALHDDINPNVAKALAMVTRPGG